MTEQISNEVTSENVLIAGISRQQPDFDYTMTELGELAKADNYTVVGEVRQNLDRAVAATYFGSGKVDDIRQLADVREASTVIINDELSPSQLRNLEKQTKLHVIDRTQLILDIFADRARSKAAKTQVEIAQLQYALPRLHPSANRLDQQVGGGAGFARVVPVKPNLNSIVGCSTSASVTCGKNSKMPASAIKYAAPVAKTTPFQLLH